MALLLVMDADCRHDVLGFRAKSLLKNMFFSHLFERIFCAILSKLLTVEQEINYGQTETYYE